MQYISHCITLAVDVLDWHYEERNNLFHYTISNEGFNQTIRLVARMYRRKQQTLSHPYSQLQSCIQTPSDDQCIDPPTSSNSSNNPPPSDTQYIPILPEPSNTSSSSSFVIAPNEELDPITQLIAPSPKHWSHQLHILSHLGTLVNPPTNDLQRSQIIAPKTHQCRPTWWWSRIITP